MPSARAGPPASIDPPLAFTLLTVSNPRPLSKSRLGLMAVVGGRGAPARPLAARRRSERSGRHGPYFKRSATLAMPALAHASSCSWFDPELPTPPIVSFPTSIGTPPPSARMSATSRCAAYLGSAVRFGNSSVVDSRGVGLSTGHLRRLRACRLVAHHDQDLTSTVDHNGRCTEAFCLALRQRGLCDRLRQAERQVALRDHALRRCAVREHQRDGDGCQHKERSSHRLHDDTLDSRRGRQKSGLDTTGDCAAACCSRRNRSRSAGSRRAQPSGPPHSTASRAATATSPAGHPRGWMLVSGRHNASQ